MIYEFRRIRIREVREIATNQIKEKANVVAVIH